MTDQAQSSIELRPMSIPHAGFDVLHATDDELNRYQVPPCPNPDVQSDVAKLWARVFNDLDAYTTAEVEPHIAPSSGEAGPAPTANLIWAGAVLEQSKDPEASPFGPFIAVTCEFDVPFVRPLDPLAPQPIAVAIWAGMDGYPDGVAHSQGQVLQAGMQAHLVPRGGHGEVVEPTFRVFIEWFPLDPISFAAPDGRLGPLDRLSLFVGAVNPTRGYALVKNLTQKWAIGGYLVPRPGVEWAGGSADWIVERPGKQHVWLAEFTEVSMQGCQAVTRGPAPQVYVVDLSAARYLDMSVPSKATPGAWETLATAVPGAATTTVDVTWQAFD